MEEQQYCCLCIMGNHQWQLIFPTEAERQQFINLYCQVIALQVCIASNTNTGGGLWIKSYSGAMCVCIQKATRTLDGCVH